MQNSPARLPDAGLGARVRLPGRRQPAGYGTSWSVLVSCTSVRPSPSSADLRLPFFPRTYDARHYMAPQPPWSFGFDSQTRGTRENRATTCVKVPGSSRVPPGKTGRHPVLKYRVPHGSQPRPGWAPDPLMVGIRSPDGLVVGSCTSQPGVLGSIPKREEPGKTGLEMMLFIGT